VINKTNKKEENGFHWMTWQKWYERERTVNERKQPRLEGVLVSTILKSNGGLLIMRVFVFKRKKQLLKFQKPSE